MKIEYGYEEQLIEIDDCVFKNWKHTDKINRIIDGIRKKEETKRKNNIFILVNQNIEIDYWKLKHSVDTKLISATNIIVKKSDFIGNVLLSFPIIVAKTLRLENSKFRNCKPIDCDNWYKHIIFILPSYKTKNSIIKNTDFINTTGISVVNYEYANFSVINCSFKNGVISALHVKGSLNLEHSIIENCKFNSKETQRTLGSREYSIIYIQNNWKNRKDTKDSHIRNSIFLNCETFNEHGENSIVSMSGYDKEGYWRCKIENCRFIKCNVHKGKIINGSGTKLNFWADSIKNFIQEENCEKIDCIIET